MEFSKNPWYLGLVFGALVACGGKDPQATRSAQDMALKKRLAEIAGQANQAAPAAIDEYTRLDGAKAGPGLKLTTMYTLVNPEAEGVNSETFATKLIPVVTDGSCKNPDLRLLIDRGVVVVLEYRGNDGKPIGTVSVDRNTCVAGNAPRS